MMRTSLLLIAGLAICGAATSVSAQTCLQTAGAATSARYVAHCREVSPATRPPCNAQNACELIVGEIERGCRMFSDADRPKLCAAYRFNRR